ncbi:hypothetical protein [Shewanella baltica]|uniref:hypothetical protein n=1 Tax=Shewanella baltica TaxID=62322 RepID=UPI00217DF96F|nr:hypothetical protein [Shewanella baltica]MCS6206801.1 hypothetical protein [Shewanella baltica]
MTEQLRPFEVGDCDIVAAYSKEQALTLLNEYYGDNFTLEDMDITDLSDDLDRKFHLEEGGAETLGELMSRVYKPQYLFGW